MRAAGVLRAGGNRFGQPFPTLPECVLNSGLDSGLNAVNLDLTMRKYSGADGTRTGREISEKQAVSRDLAPDEVLTGESFEHLGSAIETSLATAIAEAAKVGRFDVVAQLATELHARRQAGSNVIPLNGERRSRSTS